MNNKTIDIKGAAKTGNQPTLTVAIEQSFPKNQRIINDDLAPLLFGGLNRFWIKLSKMALIRNGFVNLTERFMTGGWSGFLVRKRYIDERLIETIEKHKITSVVNLGAGFDTRLFRLPKAQNITSWEVDQPENIKAKQKAIEKALGTFPSQVKQVSINFIDQDIGNILKQKGYTGTDKTFFIWEAVSQYLDESSIKKMFKFFSKAPTGSYLAFTYVLKDFIEGKNLYGQKLMYKKAVKGNVWHSGFNPKEIASELKNYGWYLIEELGYEELNNRYVKLTGRKLGVMELERIVFVEKL